MTPPSRLLFLGLFYSLPEVVDYSYFGISAGDGAKFAEVILCGITVVELGLSRAKLRAGDVGSMQVGQRSIGNYSFRFEPFLGISKYNEKLKTVNLQ